MNRFLKTENIEERLWPGLNGVSRYPDFPQHRGTRLGEPTKAPTGPSLPVLSELTLTLIMDLNLLQTVTVSKSIMKSNETNMVGRKIRESRKCPITEGQRMGISRINQFIQVLSKKAKIHANGKPLANPNRAGVGAYANQLSSLRLLNLKFSPHYLSSALVFFKKRKSQNNQEREYTHSLQ